MNFSTNAPRTLGTLAAAIPTAIAAIVISFFGQDWDSSQVASVLGLSAVVGGLLGYLAGDRVQKDITVPRSSFARGSSEKGESTINIIIICVVLLIIVIILFGRGGLG